MGVEVKKEKRKFGRDGKGEEKEYSLVSLGKHFDLGGDKFQKPRNPI